MASYVRKQLSFDTQNQEEMQTLQMLDKFKKNQTNVVVCALTEFMEKYKLSDKTPAELEQFIKAYPYLKTYLEEMIVTHPVAVGREERNSGISSSEQKTQQAHETASTKSAEIIETLSHKNIESMDIQVSDDAKASMGNILSMFNNNH